MFQIIRLNQDLKLIFVGFPYISTISFYFYRINAFLQRDQA